MGLASRGAGFPYCGCPHATTVVRVERTVSIWEMNMFQRLWLKLRGWGHAAGRFLLEQVLVDANRLRRVRRATLDEIEEANSPTREHLRPIAEGLTLDDLRRYVSSEDERRKSIEDKAKSNLVAITIGFPVLFAGL